MVLLQSFQYQKRRLIHFFHCQFCTFIANKEKKTLVFQVWVQTDYVLVEKVPTEWK